MPKKAKKKEAELEPMIMPAIIPTVFVKGTIIAIDESSNLLQVFVLSERPIPSGAPGEIVSGTAAEAQLLFDLETLETFIDTLKEKMSEMRKSVKKGARK